MGLKSTFSDSQEAKVGLNGPQWPKGLRSENVLGLTSETEIFAFEVKVILRLKSSFPYSQVATIGLNGPMTNRVEVRRKI